MPSLLTFSFTFTSSILNSVVVGPQARKHFQVMTDPADPRFTIFQNVDCNVAAFVEWQPHPIVEVRGIVASQQTSQWLSLSADKSSRIMEFKGRHYTWVLNNGSICLYSAASNPAEMFAKVTRGNNAVKLELTPQAVQAGLLDVSVVAAVLLQCGHFID